jgi:oxygen-independent coproporphyrinogen-3 oxidase
MTENWQRAGFGLYIHWPFCAAKCPYCDFNSHVTTMVDQVRWRNALLRDLAHWAGKTEGRVLTSIFFGGGTPSMMPPDTVAALIDAARRHWTPANDLEITLEANPTSVDAARFAGYVDGGVNRFSVGLQALNDDDLRALGRLHTVAEGRRAFDIARDLTDRVSFDLIYARQGQALADWQTELTAALKIAGEHLSLYQLTIEDGTAFSARYAAGGLAGLPDEDLSVDLYELTQDLCGAAGLPRYETSNHSRPGRECRHNLIYWRGGDWVGIGPGAHGRLSLFDGRWSTVAEKMPQAWLVQSEMVGTGNKAMNILPQTDISDEYVMMGLRTREGMDLAHLDRIGGRLDPAGLAEMVGDGHLQLHDGWLKTTESGALLLNAVLRKIVAVDP